MKLVRFGPRGKERPGVWMQKDDAEPMILDVRAMAYDIEDYNARFFEGDGIERLRFLVREADPKLLPAANVRLGAPVACGGSIICMGKNYADHVKEFDSSMPANPILFAKSAASVNGPFDNIRIPPDTAEIDGEVELAVVVGRTASGINTESALDIVAGYTVLNDVTDRAAQRDDGQWFRAKSADTFCPIGPFLITPDECGHGPFRVFSKHNGRILQDGNTAQMLFALPEIIGFLTRSMTLRPGDIVSTGTPSGIGSARKPPVYLKPGDSLETVVEGVGHQVCLIE